MLQMSIEERLKTIARHVGSWLQFKDQVHKMREGIEPMTHHQSSVAYLRQIPSNKWDKRYTVS